MRIPHAEDATGLALRALEAAHIPRNGPLVREEAGIANHVYRVGRDLIVRLGTGSDGAAFEKSCRIIERLQETVKVQRLVHADTSCREVPVPVMICEYVPGRTLMDQWPSLDRARKFARLEQLLEEVPKIHAVNFRDIECFRDDSDWSGRVRRLMRTATDRARDRGIDPLLVKALDDFWRTHNGWLDTAAEPVLIHNDAHPGNAIFSHDGELRALIDFEDAEVSPVEVEYWNIARELDQVTELGVAEIKALLRPYHDFKDQDAYTRHRLNEALWAMWSLTADLSWKSGRTCIEEAWQDYRNIIMGDTRARWFLD